VEDSRRIRGVGHKKVSLLSIPCCPGTFRFNLMKNDSNLDEEVHAQRVSEGTHILTVTTLFLLTHSSYATPL